MVVLGDKPVIEDDTFRLDPGLLNVLIEQIATLSSVYHKPPDAFVVRRGAGQGLGEGEADEEEEEEDYEVRGGGEGEVDLLDMGGMSVNDSYSTANTRSKVRWLSPIFSLTESSFLNAADIVLFVV